jgi:hypothetical protein
MPESWNRSKHHHRRHCLLHTQVSWSQPRIHPAADHELGSWHLTTMQEFCFQHHTMFDYHHMDLQCVIHQATLEFSPLLHPRKLSKQAFVHRLLP